jgi:hypothetical protein
MLGFQYEPVLISVAVRAILTAAVAWGFKASAEQIAVTVLAAEAIMAIPVRQNVTSQNTLHKAGLTQHGVTAKANLED